MTVAFRTGFSTEHASNRGVCQTGVYRQVYEGDIDPLPEAQLWAKLFGRHYWGIGEMEKTSWGCSVRLRGMPIDPLLGFLVGG